MNYQNVSAKHVGRTAFDLSHERVFSCNMGQLIPVLSEFVVPGDIFKISANTVIRFNPLIHPLMHEVNSTLHYFFVPYRILYPNDPPDNTDSRINPFCWEDFITGGNDGLGTGLDVTIDNVKINPYSHTDSFASLYPTGTSGGGLFISPPVGGVDPAFGPGSLWDFFRFAPSYMSLTPPNQSIRNITVGNPNTDPDKLTCPIDAPWRAYSCVWFNYYRDEILDNRVVNNHSQWIPSDRTVYVPIDDDRWVVTPAVATGSPYVPFDPLLSEDFRRPKYRAYEKDYFTSAQLDAQRGTPGVVSVDGLQFGVSLLPIHAFTGDEPSETSIDLGQVVGGNTFRNLDLGIDSTLAQYAWLPASAAGIGEPSDHGRIGYYTNVDSVDPGSSSPYAAQRLVGQNSVDAVLTPGVSLAAQLRNVPGGSLGIGFDINALRLAYSMQHYSEVNQRYGTRYTEWLFGHFGFSPRDERLQRPEYIGGSKSPVIFSEVLQTSASTPGSNALGELAGHGMSVDGNFIGSYNVPEYGMIIGIMSVLPVSTYGQGVDKQHVFNSRYDVYTPDFAYIGEQAVEQYEVSAIDYSNGDDVFSVPTNPSGIFGYQGAFDHLRQRQSSYHSLMQTDLASWHLGRFLFNVYSDDQGGPVPVSLNTNLITSATDDWDRAFAVTSEVADELVVTIGQRITAIRPLPYMSIPHIDGMED